MPKTDTKRTILLVEDDQFLQKVLKQRLEKEMPYTIVVASDGEEALQKVAELSPYLVLLDIIIPKKSGFEVLSELRKNPATKTLPVVVLSNLGQQEDIRQMQDLGIKDYLVKADYSLSEMVEKIKKHAEAI
ncbi:MAG: response regulator [Patescibacteria group bacterium]